MVVDDSRAIIDFNAKMAANSSRLAAKNTKNGKNTKSAASCKKVAHVPGNYATIQEAVDAVCDGGKVMVAEGVYNEMVNVTRPGIEIKANGIVTLNGQFLLSPDADHVTIQQFNIIPPATGSTTDQTGIFMVGVTGGNMKLNNITGGYTAIGVRNSSEVSISHNTISGSEWGIVLATNTGLPGDALCSKNLVAHNTVTAITASSPIHLQGNSDYNLVHDNTVTLKNNLNPAFAINAGIMIITAPAGFTCDYNTVRNNVVTDNISPGIWLTDGASNNMIGPDNIFSSNTFWGVYFAPGTLDNHLFNNTALNNLACDITNLGTGNTAVNNTYGCISGF
jgi:parallel beta-helix repeat protein